MNAAPKSQLLKALESKIECHLQQAVSIYQNLSNLELNRPSASGGWSIAQCLEHLNSYGDYYVPQICKAIMGYQGTPGASAKRGCFGNYFIKMMDPDLSVKRFKAFKGHIPASSLNGHDVVARFIGQQEELIGLLRMATQVDLDSIRIPISISRLIRLKLGDTFEFLTMHNERHIRQADRNLIK